MKLLTKEILARLPPLYATEEVAVEDKLVQIKLFTPWTSWTWFGIEYDPTDRVFFGATVTYVNSKDEERTVKIVGVDEVDPARGHVSWISPIARAVMRANEGDAVRMNTPGGEEEIEILKVEYV